MGRYSSRIGFTQLDNGFATTERVSRPMAAGLVAAAHDALPAPGAAVARDVLAPPSPAR